MANVIVIGGGEKDYWARVEDGVIVRVYPVEVAEVQVVAPMNTTSMAPLQRLRLRRVVAVMVVMVVVGTT